MRVYSVQSVIVTDFAEMRTALSWHEDPGKAARETESTREVVGKVFGGKPEIVMADGKRMALMQLMALLGVRRVGIIGGQHTVQSALEMPDSKIVLPGKGRPEA